MKVAKEQIVGMVAAVDWLLSQTDEGWKKNSAAAPTKSRPSSKTFPRSRRRSRFRRWRTTFRTCCSATARTKSKSRRVT